jgi:hypothetical protein
MRLISSLTAVVTLTAAIVVGLGAPASAAPTLLHCVGTESNSYYPPLGKTPQPTVVSLGSSFTRCVGLEPGVTSGTRVGSFEYSSRSCFDLLKAQRATYTIVWGNGAVSIVDATTTTTVAAAGLLIVITGQVTAGLFAGGMLLETVTGISTDVTLCNLGIGQIWGLSGLSNLTILRV